jgi:nucleoside-diphosphate-sugar epimerase
MRVLVTGATGLTGRHVLEQLLARGDSVRALVLPETIERMRYRDQVEVALGSLADEEVLKRATVDVEVVYHLAQLSPAPGNKVDDLIETNVNGTENLLRACADSGAVRRFVFQSSVQVYSPHPLPRMWPVKEDAVRRAHGVEHMKNYGQSKIEAEDIIVDFHSRFNLEYVILRPATIYGPGDRAVEQLLLQLVQNPRAAFSYDAQWGGMQWVYVGDLAQAILQAGTRPDAANHMFTIAGGELMTTRSVVAALRELMQPPQQRRARQFRASKGQHQLIRYDLTKAESLLGYVPQVTLKDGLEKVLTMMDHSKLFNPNNQLRPPAPGFRQRTMRNGNSPRLNATRGQQTESLSDAGWRRRREHDS